MAEKASKETIYSLPHHVVLRLKRSILADIRRQFDVNFTIMRHKHNGEDMMLVAVEGEPENRLNACDTLEDVISKIKSHSVDVPGLESYTNTGSSSNSKDGTDSNSTLLSAYCPLFLSHSDQISSKFPSFRNFYRYRNLIYFTDLVHINLSHY